MTAPARVTATGWGWRYAGRRLPAVSGVSFTIEPGERIRPLIRCEDRLGIERRAHGRAQLTRELDLRRRELLGALKFRTNSLLVFRAPRNT